MIKTGTLFRIIFFLIVIKFFLSGIYVYSEYTKGGNPMGRAAYNCPPEFSELLLIEKKRLFERAKELEVKERELKLLEQKINEQMNALEELSKEVEEKLNKISAIRDERIKLLIKAYSEMSPRKAAEQLLNMDKEMAIKILSQLKSTQVASILSAMPPDKAANLAEALSGFPQREY